MIFSRKAIVRCGLFLFIALNILYFIYSAYFQYVWHDEAIVLLHLSGHTPEELTAYLFDGQIKSIEQLRPFQGVNADRGFLDTIAAVYSSSNYDLPFYYSLLWILARFFGNSDLILRGFSVIIWFAFLWIFYHLGLQLFKNRRTALLTVFLAFLSPRFTGYALGIWEYGLYIFLATLSSFLFLKALESAKTFRDWFYYSLSIIAGLYTHVFFIFVVIAHLLYRFIHRKNLSPSTRKYSRRSWLGCFLIYSLWFSRFRYGNVGVFSWAKGRLSWEQIGNRWLSTIAGFFPDLSFFSPNLSTFTNYLFVALILFSLIYLARKADGKIPSFVILLTLVPFLGLLTIDIVLGFRYTAVGRFYLPTFIGISLGMAFLLAEGLRYHRKIASIALIALALCGLIDRIPNPPAGIRFVGYGSNIPNGYPIIDRSQNPLIISEDWLNALPLIHVTDEKTKYLWINPSIDPPLSSLKARFSHIFLLAPSEILRRKIERSGSTIEPTENNAFWRIGK